MDALMDIGRPSKIELAVFIDRGHRGVPPVGAPHVSLLCQRPDGHRTLGPVTSRQARVARVRLRVSRLPAEILVRPPVAAVQAYVKRDRELATPRLRHRRVSLPRKGGSERLVHAPGAHRPIPRKLPALPHTVRLVGECNTACSRPESWLIVRL